MSDLDLTHLRALANAANPWIEQENVGRPYMPDYQPTADSKAFYEAAHKAIPALCDEAERLGAEHTADVANLRAGNCLAVIPETFIACGEGGNYCSAACMLRASLAFAASENFAFNVKVSGEINEARAENAALRALLAEACDIAEQQDGRDSAVERLAAIRAAAEGSVKP